MKPTVTTAARAATRPNRILIILAAVWMAAAIAMGGVMTAEPATERASGDAISAAERSIQR
jgi:hypothetical protein